MGNKLRQALSQVAPYELKRMKMEGHEGFYRLSLPAFSLIFYYDTYADCIIFLNNVKRHHPELHIDVCSLPRLLVVPFLLPAACPGAFLCPALLPGN